MVSFIALPHHSAQVWERIGHPLLESAGAVDLLPDPANLPHHRACLLMSSGYTYSWRRIQASVALHRELDHVARGIVTGELLHPQT